jgi:hypothetical protein
MLMKIALVLITLLIVAGGFIALFNDGGNTIKEGNSESNDKLGCAFEEQADALDDCTSFGSEGSEGSESEGTSFDAEEVDIVEA